MIVHHTGCLHMGITNSCAKELKSALFHVPADSVRYWSAYNWLVRIINNRLSIRHKTV